MSLALAISVFVLTFIVIATDKLNKTLAAWAGACLMIYFRIIPGAEAYRAIDLDVIFLLLGMMIVTNVSASSGLFQWLAIKLVHITKGNPLLILLSLASLTALISTCLDNVTTIIIIVPITLIITQRLGVDPVPFLIIEVIASNIGGTATLVGDPPNLLIGSAANLSFMDFVLNLTPAIVLVSIIFLLTVQMRFMKQFKVSRESRARVKEIDSRGAIVDPQLLRDSVVLIIVILVGFLLHGWLGIGPSFVAIGGATMLVILSKKSVEEVLKEVDWASLLFLMGLFIIIAGLTKTGFLSAAANWLVEITGGQLTVLVVLLIWLSAIISGLIGNLPYTTAMLPVVKYLATALADKHGLPYQAVANPLWWSLALGVGLGANATPISAASNVVMVGIAERNGIKIGFMRYTKYGIFFTAEALILATIYIFVRYL